jgi:hypothetical protein
MKVIRVAAITLWVVVMVYLLIIARIPDWMTVGLAREISVPRNQSDTYGTVAPNRQFREQAIRRRHDRDDRDASSFAESPIGGILQALWRSVSR